MPGYVSHGDCSCTSDFFPKGAATEVCPDNKKNLSSFSDYANLEGMVDSLRYASNLRKTVGTPFFLNYGIHKVCCCVGILRSTPVPPQAMGIY